MLASDEGGESAGCPSECNPRLHYDGWHVSPTAGARRVVCARSSACWRATKEANPRAARQSAIHDCTMTGRQFAELQELDQGGLRQE